MKLETRYMNQAFHDAMITQYANQLRSDGYTVEPGKCFDTGTSRFQFDLYAEKNGDTRVYEFKVIGNKQEQNIQRFQEYSRAIGAVPIVVYVNPPKSKNIEIDNLGEIILSYICGEGTPPELDSLSSHSEIEDIQIDELNEVTISAESMTAAGDAVVYVNLNHGSRSDEACMTENFPMTFTAKLNSDLSIEHLEYAIDTSSWSE